MGGGAREVLSEILLTEISMLKTNVHEKNTVSFSLFSVISQCIFI